MKNYPLAIVLFVVLIPNGVTAQQQNAQATFNQANQYLQNGKIAQALDQYQKLVKQNRVSGALFINMGYSYMKLDMPGKAKYYYLKAKQFDETRNEAERGLKYVDESLSHQSAVLPALPWEQALNWLQINMGAVMLLGIGLILLNAGIFFFIGCWFIDRSVALLPKIATAIAATGVLILLLSFYVDYRQQRYHKAVMVTQQASVRERPDAKAPHVNEAYEGYSFTVDQRKSAGRENWKYVQMSNGTHGWIPAEEIMIL